MAQEARETTVQVLVEVLCRVGWLQTMSLDQLIHIVNVSVYQLLQGLVATH